MSGERPLSPLEPRTTRLPDAGTSRFSSDNGPAPNDRSTGGATQTLYTVIQQLHHDLESLGRHFSATAPGADPATARMASGSDRDLRPRFNRDPPLSNDPSGPSLPPLRLLGSRTRAPAASSSAVSSAAPLFRSSRYRPASSRFLERYRSHPDDGDDFAEFHRNLAASPDLRAFWESTSSFLTRTPRPPPAVSPPLLSQDMAEDSRRIKRRKLDFDRPAPSFTAFRYGKFGQVEPGQLTMEIVSCDGGLYSDEHSYPPENILRNDASVYCTKSSRCNIVLKHQGGTVFSLKELVIKAPGSKFSCPVREGMVFVAMEWDDLLTRTAQYQIQYLPSRSHRRATVIIRHDENGSGPSRIQSRRLREYSFGADVDDDDDDDDDDDGGEEEYHTAQIPPEFTVFPSPFNVATEFSDDESDGDGALPPSPGRRRRTPNRIGALPFESDSDDDHDSIISLGEQVVYRHWPTEEEINAMAALARRRHRSSSSRAATRGGGERTTATGDRGAINNNHNNNNNDNNAAAGTGSSGSMTLEEAQEASQIATQEAVRAVGGELMTPLAHFFIEKDKNKCTVRFDPPVSGRFILLKMWSPQQDSQKNIDIQAVVAKGFAGPRYSPAVELA